jgi:FkbM family methyltransferase
MEDKSIGSLKKNLMKLHYLLPAQKSRAMLIQRIYYWWYYYFQYYISNNGFRTLKESSYFKTVFKNGITILTNENISWELVRTLPGYLARYKIRKGDIIVDCGAFLGEFAIYASKVVGPNGKVIAFEPDIDSYNKLTRNIDLNKINNIIAIPKGVWSKNATLELNSNGVTSSLYSSGTMSSLIKIPVVSLDYELNGRGIEKVNFIKMDIEGAEIEAIKGSTSLLTNGTNLAIASYHLVDGQMTCNAVEKLLTKLGYSCITSNFLHRTTYAVPLDLTPRS